MTNRNRIEALRSRWFMAQAAGDKIASRQLGWLAGWLARPDNVDVDIVDVDKVLTGWVSYCLAHPNNHYGPWHYSFLRGYYGR